MSCMKAQHSLTTPPSPFPPFHRDDSGSLSLVDKDSLSGRDVTAAFLLEAKLCPVEQQENLCVASQSSHVLGRRRTASAAVLCRHVSFPSDFFLLFPPTLKLSQFLPLCLILLEQALVCALVLFPLFFLLQLFYLLPLFLLLLRVFLLLFFVQLFLFQYFAYNNSTPSVHHSEFLLLFHISPSSLIIIFF